MDIEVTDIDENVRIFPAVGNVRVTLKTKKGDKTLRLPIRKVDKFSQLLMSIAETGRETGAESGKGWTLMDDDIIGEKPEVVTARSMPFSATGTIGVQLQLKGGGLATIQLSPELAQTLCRDIAESAEQLAAGRNLQ